MSAYDRQREDQNGLLEEDRTMHSRDIEAVIGNKRAGEFYPQYTILHRSL